MDPNLTCIDPNLLQLSQLLEEDEEVPPPIRTPSAADGGDKSAVEGKERIDDTAFSETVAAFSEAKKRLSEDDVLSRNAGVSEEKKPRLDIEGEKVEDLRPTVVFAASLTEAQARISEHENNFGVQFRRHKNPKNFGRSDWRSVLPKKKVYWEGESGNRVPFVKAAPDYCVYECQHGPDHDSSRKRKRKLKNNSEGTSFAITKKVGCPARIVLEEHIRFPEFRAGSDEVSARSLRDKLRKFFVVGKGEKLKGERRIKLTFVGDHNHDTGLCDGGHLPFTDEPFAMIKGNADPVMIDRIHQLVRQGCTRLKECQSRLHRFVVAELGGRGVVGPPSRKEVLNHMGIAKAQYAKLLSEQRPVLAFVEEWRDQHPCDLIFFRPHQAETEATTVSDASLSEETWSRIKQLEKEGAVFLMNEENQVLAFGRKLPPEYILPCGGGGGREMPKFEVTEVMSQGTKVPAKDIVLKEGITTAWPGNLVLDVVVEALDEKVDDVGEDGDPRDSLKQPGDTLLFVYQSAPERSALIRHGNGVFFLDLLCRAKRSNLAVYAVKVLDSGKNKERYGAFIVTQNDRHEESGLREALVLLRSRSSKEWNPAYCITTHALHVSAAVEAALPGCRAIIDRDSRVREWERWFSECPGGGGTSCSAEMSRLRKSVEALADATTIADCSERLTEAKACLSTVPSHSARAYWERTWLNRADRFADALCPISRLGASRSERRYIFLEKPAGVSLSKDEYYLSTRRVINFDRLVQKIVAEFSMSDRHESSSTTSVATSAFVGLGRDDEAAAAIESLKQIATVLTSGVSTEGASSVAVAKTVTDLMALLPKHGSKL